MSADPAPVIPPEELNGFLLVHAALRKGGRDLLAATDRFGDRPDDPAVLTRLWGFYSRGLRQHHQGEDGIIYPLVTTRRPDFADVEADMRSEHHTVDELLAAADAAFAGLGTDPRPARANEAHGRLTELAEALDAHLVHEETAALPVVAMAISEREMTKIEKGFLREVPRRDLGLLLAALEATTKDHPELHLPPVPKPALVLLSLIWRRRYAALVAQA
jgi:iron-sulfur cluster repair protein YtfE (RIC family)